MDQDLYTIGQFMSLAHVTKKTLRYYDEHHILKPSYVSESGARFYSQQDLAKLQQILLLKYLGFSLADIREMTLIPSDELLPSLVMQKKLIDERVEQLKLVSSTLQETCDSIGRGERIDWSSMLGVIHQMGMEQSLKQQYQNASNITSRINLHALYSKNAQGWFPWVFDQCDIDAGRKVLEIGCGDGSIWQQSWKVLPQQVQIILSDVSQGMVKDARARIGDDPRFEFLCFGGEQIPFEDASVDLVIANHVLFYGDNPNEMCAEIARVLRPGGRLVCSTYGSNHMKEITELVRSFDDRIILSAKNLYEIFGRENGGEVLQPYFAKVEWRTYEDELYVTDPNALIRYVLSCHGNQTQYILDRYKEFCVHVQKIMGKGMRITKDAGVFVCEK